MNLTNLLTFAEEQRIAFMNHTAKNHQPHRRKRYSACSKKMNKGIEERGCHQKPSHEEDNCFNSGECRAFQRIDSYHKDAKHDFSMSKEYRSLSQTPSIPIAMEKCPSEPIIIARVDEYDEGAKELERYFELKTNRMQERRRRRSFQHRQGLQNAEWFVEKKNSSTFFLNHEVLALDE